MLAPVQQVMDAWEFMPQKVNINSINSVIFQKITSLPLSFFML